MVGIGALRTSQVQRLADDAQDAGASAVLLAPVTYQALTPDEVFTLFEDVTAGLSVPLVVYDNPGPALTITRAAQAGDQAAATAESARIQPLWDLFLEFGSYRVTAAIAEHLQLVAADCLPRPVLGLRAAARERVAEVVDRLGLHG